MASPAHFLRRPYAVNVSFEDLCVGGPPAAGGGNTTACEVRSVECARQGARCDAVSGRLVCTWQDFGSTSAQRLTIVSGGYRAVASATDPITVASVDRFCDDVSANVKALLGTQPFRALRGALTVVSIFEGSLEEGASHPKLLDSSATQDYANAPKVSNNNLDCSYGASMERALSCDYLKLLALGSGTGADVIVALVNDAIHGGTGGRAGSVGVASLCNGNAMTNTFVHELGHAFTELSDEYSYGISQDRSVRLTNCAEGGSARRGASEEGASAAGAGAEASSTRASAEAGSASRASSTVPWNRWRPAVLGSRGMTSGPAGTPVEDEVLQQPSAVCSFTNYAKPTNGQCIMENGGENTFCAVCRDAAVEATTGRAGAAAAPRLPLPAETVVLSSNSTSSDAEVSLFVGKILVDDSVEQIVDGTPNPLAVSVAWRVVSAIAPGGAVLPSGSVPIAAVTIPQPYISNATPGMSLRRGGETVRLSGVLLAQHGVGEAVVVAEMIDDTTYRNPDTGSSKKQPWSIDASGSSRLSVMAEFRVTVVAASDVATVSSCVRRNRTADAANTNMTTQPPLAYPFPDYERSSNASTGACGITTGGMYSKIAQPAGQPLEAAECWVPRDVVYCSVCDGTAGECDMELQHLEYGQESDVGPNGEEYGTDYTTYVRNGVIVGAVLIGGTLLLATCLYCCVTRCFIHHEGRHIEEFSTPIDLFYKIVKYTFILFALLSLGLAGYFFYTYTFTPSEILGPEWAYGTVGGAMGLYIVFQLGVAAVVSKRRFLLLLCAVVLLCMVAVNVIGLYYFITMDSTFLRIDDGLDKVWRRAVRDSPEAVCNFQSKLRCSGFKAGCNTFFSLGSGSTNTSVPAPVGNASGSVGSQYPDFCAAQCTVSNLNRDPCFLILESKLKEYNTYVKAVSGVVTGVVTLAFVSIVVLICSITPLEDDNRERTFIKSFLGLADSRSRKRQRGAPRRNFQEPPGKLPPTGLPPTRLDPEFQRMQAQVMGEQMRDVRAPGYYPPPAGAGR
eukprot:TRINITY_DN46976_c0_g1_i1.p1 TRINITY_DN46976_c0_g1~~TRINITY_DN46976_c0_g1_i1.p1  ORF type:complete len:1017 (-),score=247.70 TRINITY_DN46976_c0_g1_i1:238-3288(-)